jgi:hypothetical protein
MIVASALKKKKERTTPSYRALLRPRCLDALPEWLDAEEWRGVIAQVPASRGRSLRESGATGLEADSCDL